GRLRPLVRADRRHARHGAATRKPVRAPRAARALPAEGRLMPSPLRIPAGTVFAHDGTRISFVEEVDDFVLRFAIEGTDDEFFVEAATGVMVRPTVQWL